MDRNFCVSMFFLDFLIDYQGFSIRSNECIDHLTITMTHIRSFYYHLLIDVIFLFIVDLVLIRIRKSFEDFRACLTSKLQLAESENPE